MANFCSGVKVRLFGGAAGSMSSSVTSSFWARSIKGVELVKVMVSVLPVSPWREERLRQVSHVSLTDRARSLVESLDRAAGESCKVTRLSRAIDRIKGRYLNDEGLRIEQADRDGHQKVNPWRIVTNAPSLSPEVS